MPFCHCSVGSPDKIEEVCDDFRCGHNRYSQALEMGIMILVSKEWRLITATAIRTSAHYACVVRSNFFSLLGWIHHNVFWANIIDTTQILRWTVDWIPAWILQTLLVCTRAYCLLTRIPCRHYWTPDSAVDSSLRAKQYAFWRRSRGASSKNYEHSFMRNDLRTVNVIFAWSI